MLTKMQALNVGISLRNHFEEWKTNLLQIRGNHLDTLISTTDWNTAQMRQSRIREIDREIVERHRVLQEQLKLVNDLVSVKERNS